MSGLSTISRSLCLLAVLTHLLALTPGIVAAQGELEVAINQNATATNDGQDLIMRVKVACDPVGDVLEAFVTVEQEGVFGEGFFRFVKCDGKQHVYLVGVQPFDGRFNIGEANASAFILVCDGQDNCVDGQSNRIIRIRG